METRQDIIVFLKGWEKVKSDFLRRGLPWSLTVEESAFLWRLRRLAIDFDMPYSVVVRISRLFDRH